MNTTHTKRGRLVHMDKELGPSLGDALFEYLEAALHATLHARNVYPEEMFEVRRVLDVPIRRSRHPSLNAYIHRVLAAARAAMGSVAIDKIAFVMVRPDDPDAAPIERHVFEVASPQLIASVGPESVDQVLEGFRASLVRIGHLDERRLPRLPWGTTFSVQLSAGDGEKSPGSDWLPDPHSTLPLRAESHPMKTIVLAGFSPLVSHYVQAPAQHC